MKINFLAAEEKGDSKSAVAVLAFDDGTLAPAAAKLDKALKGALTRAVSQGRFKGEAGQTIDLIAPAGLEAARVVLVGAGKADAFDERAAETAAAQALGAVKATGVERLVLQLGAQTPAIAAAAALGVKLAAYRFGKYRTKERPEKTPSVARVDIAVDDPKAAARAFKTPSGLAEAVCAVRDLVFEPANVLFPEEFARRARKLEDFGLAVEILGEKEMKKLGMGALLGVGQGSARESQLVVIQWKGASDPDAAPVAFVGKGVCFDSGGISLKPPAGMEEMTTDMGGAGAVFGTLQALASRKAKVNAVGILGLVENMPGANAQRPGDVVKTMSGQTVEVINTDAEGRLVLCDALWYCQQRFKPQFVVDLATLTGAIVVALGKDVAGMFCNDEALAENLLRAAKETGDALWRMPLQGSYEKLLDSDVADIKNSGGREGGSIFAALFLQRFIDRTPWAHLDIAGTAWKPDSAVATIPSGATGFGVRLLDRLVADNYEG
ncbi:MAG TPA: leucyl aminopeptidase [Caulobacteraceae bacterium]|nr:leucyl aminopeptidase [Caulobacteraceae bacterium]